MRKVLCCVISVMILCACLGGCEWFDTGKSNEQAVDMNLTVNGSKVDVAAGEIYKRDNNYMVPLEETATALGYAVNWDKAEEKVTLEKNNDVKVVSIDQGKFSGMTTMADDAKENPNVRNDNLRDDNVRDDNAMELRNKPEIANDKLYVPVNFFEEVVNAKIAVDENSQTINITQNDTKQQIS